VSVPGIRLFDRPAEETRAFAIADGMWQLRLPVPYYPDVTVNAFLLRRGEGWCLVDCGSSLAPGWDGLVHAIGQAGVRPEEIELLVCTHTHSDHYGCAATVLERIGCPLALGPGGTAVIDQLRDPHRPHADRMALAVRAGVPAELQELMVLHPGDDGHHPQPPADILLEHGDVLEAAGASWRVVPTPGHAPNQIALVDEARRIVISADLLVLRALPFLQYDDIVEDPWDDLLRSIERVRAYEPELLLPGHGPPVRDPETRFSQARTLLEAAPELILGVLRRSPRSAWEIVLEAVPENEPYTLQQTALVSTLAILHRLRAAGEAEVADLDATGAEIHRAVA
jgi:glyoxylase-like metal-dependent hydrolase (beta-lactamase superfamily II)